MYSRNKNQEILTNTEFCQYYYSGDLTNTQFIQKLKQNTIYYGSHNAIVMIGRKKSAVILLVAQDLS